MSTNTKGRPNEQPEKFITVKRAKGIEFRVESTVLARTKSGEMIVWNDLPHGLFCIIFCKAVNIEIEIATMMDNYLKRRGLS